MIIYLVFDNPKYAFSPIFCSIDITDWYIEQKEKGHIYIDTRIRKGFLIPTKQECYTFLAQNIA